MSQLRTAFQNEVCPSNSVPGDRDWPQSPSALEPRFVFCASAIRGILFQAPRLFGIKSEHLELPAPFGWQIAETLDVDAAWEAAFYRGFDKIGSEERERDGHVDLPDSALLASAKLTDSSYTT